MERDLYLGIDVGGTNVKIGIVSNLGRLVAISSFKTKIPRTIDSLCEEIYTESLKLLEKENLTLANIKSVGCGLPGVINSKLGTIVLSSNLKFRDANFRDPLEKLFYKKVVVSNDANCAALGEQRFGSAKNYTDVVFITIGTGIGSGFILKNKLYEGFGGAGAEAGHMSIDYNGLECTCGNKGCWEQYASGSALIKQTKLALEKNPNSLIGYISKKVGKISARTAFEAAKYGDATANKVIEKYIDYLVVGLYNLVNIFHPQIFILGGGISNEGARLINTVNEKLNNKIVKSHMLPKVVVKKAALENQAGVIGAAALVMDEYQK